MVFFQQVKIKDGVYITSLDEYQTIGTHWISLYVNDNNVTYFDSFTFEHDPKEIKKFIGNKLLQQIFIEYMHRNQ